MEIVNESNRKPNKLWVDQGREFCNKFMKEWLDNNNIIIYSTLKEGNSVITKRFIKTLKSFMKKNSCWVNYKWVITQNQTVILEKIQRVLELSNYATRKELEHATDIDASYLAAKNDFIALKAEVDKLDINKLANDPTSLNNLKTKVDDLDVDKLKTARVDLKK